MRPLLIVAAAAVLATNSECPGEPAPIKTSCGIGISCDTTSVDLVASITIANFPATLQVGTSTNLVATAYDADNNALTGVLFTYSSSNSSVASIDASGVVTGISAGAATLSASAGTQTASRSLVVYGP